MILVHNLYHTHFIGDVESKIQNSILRSFTLKSNNYVESIDDKNNIYYVDSSRGKIPHLILAKQNTEAGNYYNDTTIKYIKQTISVDPHHQPVDIVNRFYEYLKRVLPSYIKCEPDGSAERLELISDPNQGPSSICIPGVEKIKMKAVFADIFGDLHIFKEGHRPSYSISPEVADDGTKFLCLKIKCPDACVDVQPDLKHTYNDFHFQIKGVKTNKVTGENIPVADSRYYGGFFLETGTMRRSEYPLYFDLPPVQDYIDGMLILKWKLKPEKQISFGQ